jgi:hypothetical protein
MSTVPATLDYTRFMVEPFSDVGEAALSTAFTAAFFGMRQPIFIDNAESFEIDIQRSTGVRPAQLLNRGASSRDTERAKTQNEEKFTNVPRKFPLAETYGAIESLELLKRAHGEDPFNPMGRMAKLRLKARKIHNEHMRQHITTAEILARDAIFTGQHAAIFGTTNSELIFDFYRNSNNIIAVANPWDGGSQTIIANMDSGIDAIQQNGNMFAREYGCLMGTGAFAAMKADTSIRSDADNRRLQFVELGGQVTLPANFTRYAEAGFAPRGYIETDKGRIIWIFTYDVTYIDDYTTPGVDTVTNWVPTDEALLFHPMARCDRYFGPSDRMPFSSQEIAWYQEMFGFSMMSPPTPAELENPQVIDPRMFTCYAKGTDKSVELFTQSAPVMAPTQTDGFATLTGLLT